MRKKLTILVLFLFIIIITYSCSVKESILQANINYSISKIINRESYIIGNKNNNTAEYLAYINVIVREKRFKKYKNILLILNKNDTIILQRGNIVQTKLLYQDVNYKATKGIVSKTYPNDSLNNNIQNAIFTTGENNKNIEKVIPFKINSFVEILPHNNDKITY